MDAQRRITELEQDLASERHARHEAEERAVRAEQRVVELEKQVAELENQVVQLQGQVKELLARLERNSGNSNKPPSSDPPGARAKRGKKAKSGRTQGGQPGHEGSNRAMAPPEQVNDFVNFFPPICEGCHVPLPETPDGDAARYQTVETPPIKPFITEYRVHTVKCPGCGFRTCAAHDQVPLSAFGPRLSALIALLTGVYHLSRRATVSLLSDVVGVEMSLGAVSAIEARVSAAVEPVVEETWKKVGSAEVKHTDGTSWFQGGALCALWTIATTVATVFKIVANGRMETLKKLFGEAPQGILVSDRATALTFWAMEKRQVCWAHLLRKFIAFSEMGGQAGAVGRGLLEYLGIMFSYWDDVKIGKLSREEFRTSMAPVRQHMEALLERATKLGTAPLSGSCADILAHRLALWTFVERDDVEPTNNHAERELRAFVLWRKRSYGTQSERGNRFAERLMTVAHTARKQKKDVLGFLTACCSAACEHSAPPSLFTAD